MKRVNVEKKKHLITGKGSSCYLCGKPVYEVRSGMAIIKTNADSCLKVDYFLYVFCVVCGKIVAKQMKELKKKCG